MAVFSFNYLTRIINRFTLLQRAAEDTAARSWLIGGSVRDLLCKRTPLDIDLATDKPELLANHFAALSGGHLVLLDAEHGCWRVACKDGIYFDISALRADTIIADLHLRDFSINAIAIPITPADNKYLLIDPTGGESDLRQRLLRLAYPAAITDDPARILRGYRLSAEFNLTIEKATSIILQQSAPLISSVAPERLLQEWWRICAGTTAFATINKMADDNILFALFPELTTTKTCSANNIDKSTTIWSQIMLTMEKITGLIPPTLESSPDNIYSLFVSDSHRRARLLFIALLHDIGKSVCPAVEKNAIVYYPGHEVTGAKIAGEIARRLRTSRYDGDIISKVIKLHHKPWQLARLFEQNKLTMEIIITFFDAAGAQLAEILLLAQADLFAQSNNNLHSSTPVDLTLLYSELLNIYHRQYLPAIKQPLINGQLLIQAFGLPPGKSIGRLLKQIRLQQITGEITTIAEALEWARQQSH